MEKDNGKIIFIKHAEDWTITILEWRTIQNELIRAVYKVTKYYSRIGFYYGKRVKFY